MKIINNSTPFVTEVNLNKNLFTINNEKNNHNVLKNKEHNNTNIIKFSNNNTTNTNNKSDDSNFLNSIITRNKELEERIDSMKMKDLDHIMKLEERKDDAIKFIDDFCKTNKDSLSKWMGISSDLNHILSGNTSSVLNNMSYNSVGENIFNLELGVARDGLSELKKYYDDGLNSKISYADFRKEKGESSTFDINNLSDEKKDDISLLESLKDAYFNLFNADEAIKTFKKESKQRLEEMQENIGKICGNIKGNTTLYDTLIETKKYK